MDDQNQQPTVPAADQGGQPAWTPPAEPVAPVGEPAPVVPPVEEPVVPPAPMEPVVPAPEAPVTPTEPAA